MYSDMFHTSLPSGQDLMTMMGNEGANEIVSSFKHTRLHHQQFNKNWAGMAYGNGVWVAIAPLDNTTYVTTDGITWTYGQLPSGISAGNGIAFGNGVFVVLGGSYTAVFYSTDGLTWQTATTISNQKRSIKFGGGLFVIVDWPDIIEYSSDGITWTPITVTGIETKIAFTGTHFAILHSDGKRVFTSIDAVTWALNPDSTVTYTTPGTGSTSWYGVATDGTTFVIVQDSRVMTSTDGSTWISQTVSSNQWRCVAYGAGTFVALAYGTNIASVSTDGGVTWTDNTGLPSTSAWKYVTYANGLFIALIDGITTAYATSSDGVTWASQAFPVAKYWINVAYGNGLWAVACSDSVATSTDCVSWTNYTRSSAYIIFDATTSKFLMLYSGVGLLSADCVNWTSVSYTINYSNMTASSNGAGFIFMSAQGNVIAYSTNGGVTWAKRNSFINITGRASACSATRVVDVGPGYVSTALITDIQNGQEVTASSIIDGGIGRIIKYPQSSGDNGATWQTIVKDNLASFDNRNSFVYSGKFYGFANVENAGSHTHMTISSDGIKFSTNELKRSVNFSFAVSALNTDSNKVLCLYNNGNIATLYDVSTNIFETYCLTPIWLDIAFGNGRFVAVGYDSLSHSSSHVWSSTNGVTWSKTKVDVKCKSIVFCDGEFVINSSTLLTSKDGINWIDRRVLRDKYYQPLIDHIMFYDGESYNINGYVWRGDVWVYDAATTQANAYNGIWYINNNFQFKISKDKVNWIDLIESSYTQQSASSIAYGNGKHVALYNNIANTISIDIDRSAMSISPKLNNNKVTFNGSVFCAYGTRYLERSTDGVTWTTHRLPTNDSVKYITGTTEHVILTSNTNDSMYSNNTALDVAATNVQTAYVYLNILSIIFHHIDGTVWAAKPSGSIMYAGGRTFSSILSFDGDRFIGIDSIDGTLWGIGEIGYYVGYPSSSRINDFLQISTTMVGVTKVQLSNNFGVALTSTNELWGWGDKSSLGINQTGLTVPILLMTGIVDVEVSYEDVFVKDSNGYLSTFGRGYLLGSTTPVLHNAFVIDKMFVNRGYNDQVFITTPDRSVWCMGYNNYGSLGLGDQTDRTTLQPVTGVTATKIFFCSYSTMVVDTISDTFYTFGNNGSYLNGNNINSGYQSTPYSLAITNVKDVVIMQNQIFVIKNDNTVWYWGAAFAAPQATTPTNGSVYFPNLDKLYSNSYDSLVMIDTNRDCWGVGNSIAGKWFTHPSNSYLRGIARYDDTTKATIQLKADAITMGTNLSIEMFIDTVNHDAITSRIPIAGSTSSGRILKSIDAGLTWSIVSCDLQYGTPISGAYVNGEYFITMGGAVFRSSNLSTWTWVISFAERAYVYAANNLLFIVTDDWQTATKIYYTADGITIEGPFETRDSLAETTISAGAETVILPSMKVVFDHGRTTSVNESGGLFNIDYIDQQFVSYRGWSKNGINWYNNNRYIGYNLSYYITTIGNKWSQTNRWDSSGCWLTSTNNPSFFIRSTPLMPDCYGAGVFMKYIGDGVQVFLTGSTNMHTYSWGPSFTGTYKFVYGHGAFVGVNISENTDYVGDVVCIDTKGLS